MRVFKFGGASVKDAKGVKNLAKVLKHEGFSDTLIVISAMGKMTNAFEEIVADYLENISNLSKRLAEVRKFHTDIINNLNFNKPAKVLFEVDKLFAQLSGFFISNKKKEYNFVYDQVVGFGEFLSTKIVSFYLEEIGIDNNWIDVREFVKTDSFYRDAKVDWELTNQAISRLNKGKLTITQGFLGSDLKNHTTTLGREGSDYTAAIFAHCLEASSVTIWKDVDGVLNADPRHFKSTLLLNQISYSEAIEMAFYGASVIHPKTLKPLENKNIPLFVRSFSDLNKIGTKVGKGKHLIPETACFILKQEQILVEISALDFSFMVEHNLSDIFKVLHDYKLKVNLIQNSALSFSVCIEDKYNQFSAFVGELALNYKVNFIENLSLYTIRHATEEAINFVSSKGNVLLRQTTKNTVQLIMQ